MSGGATYMLRRARRLIGKRVQYALMRNIIPRGADEKRLIVEGPRVLAMIKPPAEFILSIRGRSAILLFQLYNWPEINMA